jgi:ectoine hydroxylase-related dioxygenase (phytanoyl-CoA dioxygenase family)
MNAPYRSTPNARPALLSPSELQEYRRDGLVRPAFGLDSNTLAEMRALLDETLDATPGQRPESLVCPHIENMNGLSKTITDRWLALCGRREILDMVEEVIGPDLILWGSQLFCKPAGTGLSVPWHQDGHFWPIRPLATCTVWIAIDNVDAENGAMMFVPGSHRTRELYPHADQPSEESALNAELMPEHVDLAAAEVDELTAGNLSLHDVYLIHGSEPNRSTRRRAGFVIRYMPATSHYDREKARAGSNLVNTRLADRPLYLMRGEDWTGKDGLIDLRLS